MVMAGPQGHCRRALGALCLLAVFCSGVIPAVANEGTREEAPGSSAEQAIERRLSELEALVAELRAELAALRAERAAEQPLLERLLLSAAELTDPERRMVTVYDDGFVFVGADDTLKVGGWLQSDFRLPLSGSGAPSDFVTRRARVDLRGNLEHFFGYRVYTDFTGATGKLNEAWLDYHRSQGLRVKMGQFKEPFSLESSYSARWVDTMERSLIVTAVQPAEDLGVMVFGRTNDGRVEYAVGAFNGTGKNAGDTNSDKDLAARVAARPFSGEVLDQLYVGASATVGNQDDVLGGKAFRTAANSKFLTFADGVEHHGDRTRTGLELEWLRGPTSVKTEWVRSDFDGLTMDGAALDADLQGWHVTVAHLLSGESKRRNAAVVPAEHFDLAEGHWGAWELVAKYERLEASSTLFSAGFAAGTDLVTALTFGLNWWPNRHTRVSLNWVRSRFDDLLTIGGVPTKSEDALLFRHQFNF